MLRQIGAGIDRRDLFARDVCERIEFQSGAIVLDHGDRGARAALKALAAVDPGAEWLQRLRQRLYLAQPAAGIGIGKPQLAIRVFVRQRLLERLDRTDVAQAELL